MNNKASILHYLGNVLSAAIFIDNIPYFRNAQIRLIVACTQFDQSLRIHFTVWALYFSVANGKGCSECMHWDRNLGYLQKR